MVARRGRSLLDAFSRLHRIHFSLSNLTLSFRFLDDTLRITDDAIASQGLLVHPIARYFGYYYGRWMIFFTEYVEEEGRKKGKSASSEWLAGTFMTLFDDVCTITVLESHKNMSYDFFSSLISTYILLKCFFEIFDFATQIELFWKKKSYFQTLWPQANDCLKRKQTCNRRMDAFYTTFKYCWCHLALILNQDQKRSALCLSSDWIISPKAELEACPLSVKTQMLPSQGQFWFSSIIAQEKN